ncbi:hypothetical protein [Vulcanococcus limneticus]|uniref:hypothetical protein n=1 Tax=Vulcanococcus limneticus TaxID=2170428 RepID=UPI00398BE153
MAAIPPSAAQACAAPTRLEQLEALIARDRRRKALLLLPVTAGIGAAVALQATWVLALAATGLLALQTLNRPR